MTRVLAAAILVGLLSGCQTVAVAPTSLGPLDLSLTRRCDAPVFVPDRDLSEKDVVSLWGTDRIALRDCGRRLDAVVQTYESRDAKLAKAAGAR